MKKRGQLQVDALPRMPHKESLLPPKADDVVCVVANYVSYQEFVQKTLKDKLQQLIQRASSAWSPVKSLQPDMIPFHRAKD